MNQMVLPQTPPPRESSQPAKQPEQEKSGDSRFDEVSRTEEKRLARKQAEQKEEAGRKAGQQGEQESAKPAEDKPAREAASEQTRTTPSKEAVGAAGPEEPPELLADLNPVDLDGREQPLLFAFGMPQPVSAGNAPDPVLPGPLPVGGARLPGSGPGSVGENANGMIKGMLMMALGKSGEAPGKTAGLQFADLMPAQAAQEVLKAPDPSSLVNSQRLAPAPDLTLQQQAALNGRMAGEHAPLKGYTTSVDVPVGQAEWGDKVMGKLTWLTANKLSVAEIHLTPPDMGPMEVRVQVQQDQTSITVHAANSAVRDQLELHSHRLRDMLGEQGLNLEKFDVSDSSQQQAGHQASSGEEGHSPGEGDTRDGGSDDAPDGEQTASVDLSRQGEVDIFA